MNNKSISVRDIKAWKNAKFIYRTSAHTDYGYRFYSFDIMSHYYIPNMMSISFQMNMESYSLFQCYAGHVSNLKLVHMHNFIPLIKQISVNGYLQNGIRRLVGVLNKNKIIRCEYNNDLQCFVPYKYRKNAKQFMDAVEAITFNKVGLIMTFSISTKRINEQVFLIVLNDIIIGEVYDINNVYVIFSRDRKPHEESPTFVKVVPLISDVWDWARTQLDRIN
jgi:hypothetical protein